MDGAYDLQALFSRMKKVGLDGTEKVLADSVVEALTWFEESAKLSATPFDDVAVVVIPALKKQMLELIDKLDGQVG